MINNSTEEKNKQETNSGSKKLIKRIATLEQEVKKSSDRSKDLQEKSGYGDLSLKEFLEAKPPPDIDQASACFLMEAQNEAWRAIKLQKKLDEMRVPWQELIDGVAKSKLEEGLEEAIEKVVKRVALLQEIEDRISADILQKKLKDAAKPHGVTSKAIDALIDESVAPKKQKDNAPIKLPFEVLGYNADNKILIWHNGRVKRFTTLQIRAGELEILARSIARNEEFKTEVIELANQKGEIDDEELTKSGVWKFSKDWIVVSGREPLLMSREKATPLEGPVFKDRIIHFEKNGWVKINRIAPGTCSLKETFDFCFKHISQWEWQSPSMADYVTAFVMLSPFQQAMNWRPWLYVTGPTSCGKSAFFESVLEQVYGCLVKKIDKATAHSVAQAVGSTSKILILDEFEKNKHIPDILEVLKLMSRGGAKTSGTPGKSEISYALHHMPWMASIYLPRTLNIDESQRNRMIRFDLKKKKEGKFLNVLSSEETESLCANIISSVVPVWGEIQKVASQIEKETPLIMKSLDGKVSGRMVQNFMYASAMLSIVKGKPYTVPGWAKQEESDDGQTIIKAILNAKIRHELHDHLIIDLIETVMKEPTEKGNSLTPQDAQKALRLHGISTVYRERWFVALHPPSIRKFLFKGDDDYKDLDISAPLERITGAARKKTAWGKADRKQRCIHIPIDSFFTDKNE